MKSMFGALAASLLLALAAPAAAQHGGFHGGGHGGHFHGGHGGHFHGGHFHGGPFFGFGLGLGYYGYGYPAYGYGYSSSYDDYPYANPVIPQPAGACGTWVWHADSYSYGWLACGATAEINVPMSPPAAAPQAPR